MDNIDIHSFVDDYINGRIDRNSPENLQYYQNNSKEIEELLAKKASGSTKKTLLSDIKSGARSFKDSIVGIRARVPSADEAKGFTVKAWNLVKRDAKELASDTKSALINSKNSIVDEAPKAFAFAKDSAIDFAKSPLGKRMFKGAGIGAVALTGIAALSNVLSSGKKPGEEYHPEEGHYIEKGIPYSTTISLGAVAGAGTAYLTKGLDTHALKAMMVKEKGRVKSFASQVFATGTTGGTRQSWTGSSAITGALAAAEGFHNDIKKDIHGLIKSADKFLETYGKS